MSYAVAILGMVGLDPVIDLADTAIDFVDFLDSQIILKQNQVSQSMIGFDILLSIKSYIDDKIEDIEDDYEISKIQSALYNPKILNKLLGDALNFGAENPVVKFIDSPYDWDIPSWLQWAENIWFKYTSLPQDRYDFGYTQSFKPSASADPDTRLWQSEELFYCNAKFPRTIGGI